MIKQLLSLLPATLVLTGMTSRAQTPPFIPPSTYTGTSVNYVRTWEATAPSQTPSTMMSGPNTDVKQTTQYYDGFGRPMQNILKQASPLGNDLVQTNLYNSLGQQQYSFQQFVSNVAQSGDVPNNGTFKTDAFMQQEAFYNGQLQGQPAELYTNGANHYNWAYQETDYEASPLNRVLDSYAPGVNWVGTQGAMPTHNVQNQFLINTAADDVQMWSISAAQGSIPASIGTYAAGTLHKSVAIDEQGNQNISYNDTYGQVVLKKVQSVSNPGTDHTGWLCTYSVYDDNGSLRFIIPPTVVTQIAGTWSISQILADEYCYRFEYDALNRMVIKRTPGTGSGSAGEMWMVYDVRNRLVMSQDGDQRMTNQWLCAIYDALDRKVLTGTITSTNSLTAMQTQVTSQTGNNSSGTVSGSTPTIPTNPVLTSAGTTGTESASQSITLNPGFSTGTSFTAVIVPQPINNTVVVNNNPIPSGAVFSNLTAVFYDNYAWVSTAGVNIRATLISTNIGNSNYFNTSYETSPTYAEQIVQSAQTQGLATGGMELAMAPLSQNLYTSNIYDEKGRLIQVQSTNVTQGTDVITFQYDFIGKTIRSLLSHIKSGTNPQSHLVSTAMNYDAMGRLLNVTKYVNSTEIGASITTPATTIGAYQYNELGQVKQRTLGNNLETMQYDYNVRGWSLGMNRSYAKTVSSTSNYFGYDLGYDQPSIADANGNAIGSYVNQRYNGALAGGLWKTKGDNQQRKYDYTYFPDTKLMSADFNQQTSGFFNKSAGVDFSVTSLGYDPNGNINGLNQNGWIIGGSQQIDKLAYTYLPNNGNQLQNVMDNSTYNLSNPASQLGDFHYAGTKTGSTTDYSYDNNGNVLSDANRNITNISYNLMNVPQIITFGTKGSIQFVYDASGKKLQKQTIENNASVTYNGTAYPTSITTTNKYVAGFVYQSLAYGNASLASLQYTDKLQFLSQEEGRVRALYTNAASPNVQTGYAFDYFMRDNVDNVRVVLTDEHWLDTYPAATLETSALANEEKYYTVNTADVTLMNNLSWWLSAANTSYVDSNAPYSNPGDANASATSQYMYKLNGSTGDQFGLGVTLKVMSGDQVSIVGKSIWNNTGSVSEPYPLSSVIGNLLSAFAGTAPVTASHFGATGAALDASSPTTSSLTTLLSPGVTQANPAQAPNAGINWILFNDQFQAIASGTSLVSATGNSVYTHPQINVPITANGYLYVFCSNESNADVFFDNLQVLQNRGPILEEDHYYPQGLLMAGISDHSWNKLINNYHYQSKEMQDKEFSDGTGLAEHDFGARYYDQQLGRWHTQDPDAQFSSPYTAMGNNWQNGTDPTGKSFLSSLGKIAEDVGAFIALGGAGYIGASLESGSFSVNKWNNKWWEGAIVGDVVAAAAVVGVAEVTAPATATSILGLSPAATSIAEGAASGVAMQMGGTIVSNVLSGQQAWQWDQQWKSALVGAALGAFSGLNPQGTVNDDGSLTMPKQGGLMGLRTPATDEGLLSAWGNRTLYNLVEVTGGSIGGNWINNRPLFSQINVPLGPAPFELSFGKGQVLFNWKTNAESSYQPILEGLWGGLNSIYPAASYTLNVNTLNASFGGDNLLWHMWPIRSALIKLNNGLQSIESPW